MTEDRPAQRSPDWDPTVADPLHFGQQDPYDGDPRIRPRWLAKAAFTAVLVVLAILAAALLSGVLR